MLGVTDYFEIFTVAELRHYLAADSARRTRIDSVFSARNGYCAKIAPAVRHGFEKAVRSAQTVGVYAAFSMLHPVYTDPSEQRSAAPTLYPE